MCDCVVSPNRQTGAICETAHPHIGASARTGAGPGFRYYCGRQFTYALLVSATRCKTTCLRPSSVSTIIDLPYQDRPNPYLWDRNLTHFPHCTPTKMAQQDRRPPVLTSGEATVVENSRLRLAPRYLIMGTLDQEIPDIPPQSKSYVWVKIVGVPRE